MINSNKTMFGKRCGDGFTIEKNRFRWFNVTAINCFSAQSEEPAKRAIDRYAVAHNLCEHGVPKLAERPVCGCPGSLKTKDTHDYADMVELGAPLSQDATRVTDLSRFPRSLFWA